MKKSIIAASLGAAAILAAGLLQWKFHFLPFVIIPDQDLNELLTQVLNDGAQLGQGTCGRSI